MADASGAAPSPKKPAAPKERSPSFPFIPLKAAVERLVEFEKCFGRHHAPVGKAGLAWKMKERSSQSDQTLAALKAFGLIEYHGAANARQAHISDEGRRYLRAQQESIKQDVLRSAALRPKIIEKFWREWGADRPPDPVCLDDLVLKNAFSDNGAKGFLKVYDATIDFAGLRDSDKIPPVQRVEDVFEPDAEDEDVGRPRSDDPPPPPRSPPAPPATSRVAMIQGERELVTGMLSKETNFRVIVSGPVGVKEIDRLIKKLEFDKDILADPDPPGDAGTFDKD
jgi:hypothetical protein